MGTEIEVAQVTNALAQFDKVGLGLAELEKSYKGVIYPVTTKDGMKAAVAARRAIREPRVAVEKLRKEAKAPILALGRKLDSEAERITNALEALEAPIDEQITNEQDRLHNDAVAKATAERERLERLEARLDAVRLMPYDANGLDSKTVQTILDEAKALPIGDDWQEYKDKATSAKIATVAALEGVLAKALAAEAEAARIIAERAELEKLRAENATRDAEARKAQDAENARIRADQIAEGERLIAQQIENTRKAREAADALKAEQDKIDAQRAEIARKQKEIDNAQKERTRLDNVGFRAHHQNMSLAEKEQLQALSDASPETDVFALALPVVEPEIELTPYNAEKVARVSDNYGVSTEEAERLVDAEQSAKDLIPAPADDEICLCVADHFKVSYQTALTWLMGFGK